MPQKPNTPDNFWQRVDQSGGPDACWPWKGAIGKHGYGVTSLFKKNIRPHRLAYEYARGPIPEGKIISHKCDFRPCCNPSHLFLATNAENSADMVSKNRQAKGERNGMAKLTAVQVSEIRSTYQFGVYGFGAGVLAAKYGVSKPVILGIIHKRNWKD